jgi:hypothetical protein
MGDASIRLSCSPMQHNPIVLIHGYSDEAPSFQTWKRELVARGFDSDRIHIVCYKSLTNEVTIKDIAEAFDRALALKAGLGPGAEFDAIVHSTGMLVLRSWLTRYPQRKDRLKRLVALAPASFGSPLAHRGRSWIGSIFKGSKEIGPDFGEAGDLILDSLELGSRFTWDLAHEDLLGPTTYYGADRSTPYVFIFCGNEAYGGFRKLINEPGTDGTVRWAGCALNTRKIEMDLTRPAASGAVRYRVLGDANVDSPLYPVAGMNHGTILSAPTAELVELVATALRVDSKAKHAAWTAKAARVAESAMRKMDEFQQFVVRAMDERGDPITDFNILLHQRNARGNWEPLRNFDLDPHAYSSDRSFKCFHVNLSDLRPQRLKSLGVELVTSSGTEYVGYLGYGSDAGLAVQRVMIDISEMLAGRNFKFFYPFTTTLIELTLNREPLPVGVPSRVCHFWDEAVEVKR